MPTNPQAKNTTEPHEWFCDQCHEPVNADEGGVVAWMEDGPSAANSARSFSILHSGKCLKRFGGGSLELCDEPLTAVTGGVGLNKLIGDLYDRGAALDPDREHPARIRDSREFAEFLRRLYVPHYEQARPRLAAALSTGALVSEGKTHFSNLELQDLADSERAGS